jgi:hypothetical protein
VAYKRSGSTRTMTKPIDSIPADGVVRFSISPIDGQDDDEAHEGPLPMFVDIIAAGEEDDFYGEDEPDLVVSNTAAVLIDVKAGSNAGSNVAGTTWQFGGGSDSSVTFYANGEVDFSDTEAGGKWRQVGNKLSFDCNDFTLFEVTISGDHDGNLAPPERRRHRFHRPHVARPRRFVAIRNLTGSTSGQTFSFARRSASLPGLAGRFFFDGRRAEAVRDRNHSLTFFAVSRHAIDCLLDFAEAGT